MCTAARLTTERYRMVPLAALERAQGELQSAYQLIARLQQNLMAHEKTPAAPPAAELWLCTCGHTRLAHTGEGGRCSSHGCDCTSFFPRHPERPPDAAPIGDSARCTCGHAYAAHTYRNSPACSLCKCPGFKAQ